MEKLIAVLSILALIVTGINVAVGIDIALQGALVTDGMKVSLEPWLLSQSSMWSCF